MLEVSELLYLVAGALQARDSGEDFDAVSRQVSGELGRSLSPAQLVWLVEHKLAPLGMLEGRDVVGTSLPGRPVLGSSLRHAVVPGKLANGVASALRPLFLPPVVLAALASLVAVDVVLASTARLGQGLHQIIAQPGLVATAFALMLAGAAFHELGHATASRYGGAQPGAISVGLYVVWPAFSNNLNDSYRLSRPGRLRVDLGGVYFNVLFVLVLAGIYGVTGFGTLLVVVVGQHLAILQQFLPFLRLDGYYLVSDAIGVPDLFGRIRPVVASLVPGRPVSPSVSGLRRRARAVVTLWVLITVPLLATSVVLLGFHLPALLTSGWHSLAVHARATASAALAGRPIGALVGGLQVLTLVVPLTGLTVVLLRLLRRGLRLCRGLAAGWSGRRSPPPAAPSNTPEHPLTTGQVRSVMGG